MLWVFCVVSTLRINSRVVLWTLTTYKVCFLLSYFNANEFPSNSKHLAQETVLQVYYHELWPQLWNADAQSDTPTGAHQNPPKLYQDCVLLHSHGILLERIGILEAWRLGLNIGYPVGYPKIPWWIRQFARTSWRPVTTLNCFLALRMGRAQRGWPKLEMISVKTWETYDTSIIFIIWPWIWPKSIAKYDEIWANYHHQIGWDRPISQAFKIYSGTESFANAYVPFVMQLISTDHQRKWGNV